jgi:hypothetical protein
MTDRIASLICLLYNGDIKGKYGKLPRYATETENVFFPGPKAIVSLNLQADEQDKTTKSSQVNTERAGYDFPGTG